MKKWISAILAAVLIAAVSFGNVTAGAVGATTGEVDVVFLVDSSRSMTKNDPDYIRLEAIRLFADLCSLGNTKVGYVFFGDDIRYSQEPIPINTEEDRTALKDTVSGLTKLSSTTDIGMAVLYAAEMLASDEYTGSGKFIVFLSDGKTVIPNGSDRTLDDSQTDLKTGIITAQNAGIPIYTIGLNASGDVNEEELNEISESTYADKTYMTDSAGDLSEILSDIYVRHTGAETSGLGEYVSDGGLTDTEFEVAGSSVVEANLVVMHSAPLDEIKVFSPDGSEVPFDGTAADVSKNDGYSLAKIYYPAEGTWRLSVKSPKNTQVDINYILTRDYKIELTLLTDKEIAEGTTLKFDTVLTGLDSVPIDDYSVLSRLVGKAVVKNTDTDETSEAALVFEDNRYKGTYVLPADGNYTVQVSLYNKNTDIRSDILTLEAGSEQYKEPEGPLKMILIIAGSVIVLVIAVVFIIKQITKNIRMWSGRLTVTVNMGGMPSAPLAYDFAKKVPGKRKVMLSAVIKDLFKGKPEENAIPSGIIAPIVITMTESGDIRVLKVKELEYTGGVTLGKNVILSNANRLTLRYTDKAGGTNNTVIIQYSRT